MKKNLIIALLVVLCFILQSALFRYVQIATVTPNLLLILCACFGFMRGKKEGLLIGFFCGLLIDLFFNSDMLGFNALLYMFVGYLNGFFYKIYYDEDIKVPMLLVAVSDFALNTATYAFRFLLRGRLDYLTYLRQIILPDMVYTVLFTLIFYRLLFKLNQKFVDMDKKGRSSTWLRR